MYAGSIELPEYVDARVLAANTSEAFTTPANADWFLISGDGGFYIIRGATAAVPAADVTDGTASFYVPAGFQCKVPRSTQIAVIATATRIVTIAPYPR